MRAFFTRLFRLPKRRRLRIPGKTAASPQTVTPDTLALTLSAFAPTVSTPRLCTPTTAALTLSTFAPTVTATGAAENTGGLFEQRPLRLRQQKKRRRRAGLAVALAIADEW